MKSGDQFQIVGNITNKRLTYTLQKLPDFDLWLLINNDTHTHWTGPKKSPVEAMGGWKFEPLNNDEDVITKHIMDNLDELDEFMIFFDCEYITKEFNFDEEYLGTSCYYNGQELNPKQLEEAIKKVVSSAINESKQLFIHHYINN